MTARTRLSPGLGGPGTPAGPLWKPTRTEAGRTTAGAALPPEARRLEAGLLRWGDRPFCPKTAPTPQGSALDPDPEARAEDSRGPGPSFGGSGRVGGGGEGRTGRSAGQRREEHGAGAKTVPTRGRTPGLTMDR